MNMFRAVTMLFIAAVAIPSAAQPAEITYRCYIDRCAIQLKGDIEVGDYDSFRNVFEEVNSNGLPASGIILLSRGGNVSEAIRIGRLVRSSIMFVQTPENEITQAVYNAGIDRHLSDELRERLTFRLYRDGLISREGWELSGYFVGSLLDRTQISNSRQLVEAATAYGWDVSFDADATCASACALIAVSAVRRSGGPVGLHHISVENKDVDFSDLNNVLSSGNSEVSSFLAEMRAPSSFLEIMASTPSQEMEWFDLPPYDPIFQEFEDARCPGLTTSENGDLLNLVALRDIGFYIDNTGKSIRRNISNAELSYLSLLDERDRSSRDCRSDLLVSTWRQAQGLD